MASPIGTRKGVPGPTRRPLPPQSVPRFQSSLEKISAQASRSGDLVRNFLSPDFWTAISGLRLFDSRFSVASRAASNFFGHYLVGRNWSTDFRALLAKK